MRCTVTPLFTEYMQRKLFDRCMQQAYYYSALIMTSRVTDILQDRTKLGLPQVQGVLQSWLQVWNLGLGWFWTWSRGIEDCTHVFLGVACASYNCMHGVCMQAQIDIDNCGLYVCTKCMPGIFMKSNGHQGLHDMLHIATLSLTNY